MRRFALGLCIACVWASRSAGEFWHEPVRPAASSHLVASGHDSNGIAIESMGRQQAALHATQLALERSFVHAQHEVPRFSLQALEAQRNRNPASFDHVHPLAGPVIGEITRFQAGLFPPSSSRVNELLARRALDATRFDHYNPVLGRLLAIDLQLHAAAASAPLNGFLPNTPRINTLRWRRSLNPRRFDHDNPTLGRLLAEDQLLREGLVLRCPSLPVIYTPPGLQPPGQGNGPPPHVPLPHGPPHGPPPHGPPPSDGGPQVPEPSSLALLLLGSLWIIGIPPRRHRRTPASFRS